MLLRYSIGYGEWLLEYKGSRVVLGITMSGGNSTGYGLGGKADTTIL